MYVSLYPSSTWLPADCRSQVIKKRQPPPPPDKRKSRRRSTITPANIRETSHSVDEQYDQLISLSDMLFGGQLTSILVCQKCKHVSQTYEDFNDLSLSIKAEDYAKKRKRDRLKKLARKMGMGGGKAKRTVSVTEPQSDLVISSPSASSEHRLQEPNLDTQKPPDSNIPGSTGMRASSVPPTPNTGGIVEHEPIFSPDGSRRRRINRGI